MNLTATSLFLCISLSLSSLVHPLSSKAPDKGRDYYEERGDVVWEVKTEHPMIALTFDDGPDPVYTPQILALLKKYDAKATFFVLGAHVKKNPELSRSIVGAGHEIGNHTYSHPNFFKLRPDQIQQEIEITSEIITAVTGKTPVLFRPPGGVYNETIVNTVKNLGLLTVMWSWHQDTRDWSNPGVNKIVRKVLNNARRGDIVLFHDYGGNRSQTVRALEKILPELKRRGFHFVTVSELIHIRGKLPVHMKN
ncbi:polysaccharide deacetylase family protein [Brevibacillus ruminantium]|uniref:Polysaccharide deacetylase family protein n=1 Tax=Brevibacillus ruminantium TaxID=2950604 RepID=A0ABY4WDL5_9BACL|nr:polysaccharide deacetylase family protein [Brevibacillus ruminantium]USG65285.1 polysaccharide deacetylase family protein [Brevibacillus ruminantium]